MMSSALPKRRFFLLLSCSLALIPFWIWPLDPGHDLSFQWQAGYDFAQHGSFYHQARGWPREIPNHSSAISYDQKWLTEWPPVLSVLVALGVRVGYPVLFVKLFFSALFVLGWRAWQVVTNALTEDHGSGAPEEIRRLFPLLPLLIYVDRMGMFDALSPLMTDWMVFLIFPFWMISITYFVHTQKPRFLLLTALTSLLMTYTKYSALFVLVVSLIVLCSVLPKKRRLLNSIYFMGMIGIGLTLLWFYLRHDTSNYVRSVFGALENMASLLSKNLLMTLRELLVYGIYNWMRASAWGSVIYLGGYEATMLHRTGRLLFLLLTAVCLFSYARMISTNRFKSKFGIATVIAFMTITSGFLFLSLLTLLSGVLKNSVIGSWSYLRDYRYLFPVVPLMFILFWKGLLLIQIRLKYVLRVTVMVAVLGGLFHAGSTLWASSNVHGWMTQVSQVYSSDDYEIHRQTTQAARYLEAQFPDSYVVCFRYEVDRGFDRYGILRGYELRKEMEGVLFTAKKKLIVFVAIPKKSIPGKPASPVISFSDYHRLEEHLFPGPCHIYYKKVNPGLFRVA